MELKVRSKYKLTIRDWLQKEQDYLHPAPQNEITLIKELSNAAIWFIPWSVMVQEIFLKMSNSVSVSVGAMTIYITMKVLLSITREKQPLASYVLSGVSCWYLIIKERGDAIVLGSENSYGMGKCIYPNS
ncbi:hypothetical protein PR048_015290 [Dryococelus australis]|uniref:Uncharacterized protein n=1 Tax=Dryococelus australis TaxID=614101 RepID=A0ABQ9HGT3_9NEOP|nr:hypothetical protein PR048_015290 [Dryococelus australis]